MRITRAKFRCLSVETFSTAPDGQRSFRFQAVSDDSVPEDQRYAKYTPIGHLSITVTNPAVTFEPGVSYYLDLIPVGS
ncbi:hypothetical protein ACFYOK_29335 [Microbispora bryophytorum]|uniref:hypothetical protein n=1 Tax=Microbispora bryophytorum TaxID=1460882 RepID=UPI0033CD8539